MRSALTWCCVFQHQSQATHTESMRAEVQGNNGKDVQVSRAIWMCTNANLQIWHIRAPGTCTAARTLDPAQPMDALQAGHPRIHPQRQGLTYRHMISMPCSARMRCRLAGSLAMRASAIALFFCAAPVRLCAASAMRSRHLPSAQTQPLPASHRGQRHQNGSCSWTACKLWGDCMHCGASMSSWM